MRAIDLSRNAAGLLVRINAVTGWRLPDDIQLAQVLTSEFTEYLHTNAGDMNSKEVISAVRNNGLTIIEWGKSMNLSFIDQCILPYKSQRAELSKVEEQAAIDQKQAKTDTLPVGAVDWSNEWNNVLYAAKIGQMSNCWIVTDLYEWLIRTGKMEDPTKEDKWDVVRQVAKTYLKEIQDALLSGAGTEPPYELKRRIALLTNEQAPIWKKDTAIMSTLNVLAKREMVRQLAIITIVNEEQ